MINLLMTSGLRLMCLFCIGAAYTLIFQILYTDILIFNYQFYCYSTIFNSNQQLLRRIHKGHWLKLLSSLIKNTIMIKGLNHLVYGPFMMSRRPWTILLSISLRGKQKNNRSSCSRQLCKPLVFYITKSLMSNGENFFTIFKHPSVPSNYFILMISASTPRSYYFSAAVLDLKFFFNFEYI